MITTNYTIHLHTGMNCHLELHDEPIRLAVEFKDGKKVHFFYDPSPEPSTMKCDDGLTPKTTEKGKELFTARVENGDEWIEYATTNIEGTEHR